MKTLNECYNTLFTKGFPKNLISDKGTDHSYIEVYDEILNSYCNHAINFLEIGISHGSCLEMWTKYFHSDSKIHGFDIDESQLFKDYGIILHGDSKSVDTKNRLFENLTFDIIIEDGEHTISSQIDTFKNYYPLVKKGGLYVIEDIQNLDYDLSQFESLGYYPKVYDLRSKKGQHDDVLFVFEGGK